jgi:histidyl-tRNA synthetase
MKGNLATDSYKGVRDFYPDEMAIRRYIFDTWSKTAESFGYEKYDASILEYSDLYKSKGAENEEIVNEQTYSFVDRGEREVTLRPEMTPTVARMVAKRKRDLHFPLRWYSIPNLFRYERPQRGRLREHWQLNCDIFGADDISADIEIIALAYQTIIDFGANEQMFEILVNDRKETEAAYLQIGVKDLVTIHAINKLNDRKKKISSEVYQESLFEILGDNDLVAKVIVFVEDTTGTNPVIEGLNALGINNVKLDRSIARGFDYYTGTIFEIVDTNPQNNRSMIGGGRYDNLTAMFGAENISGVGFGMGDVTMQDFLETNKLLPSSLKTTAPDLMIIPTDGKINLEGQKIAKAFRDRDIKVSVDIGDKKIGKKISDASDRGVKYTIVIGTDELTSGQFTLKNLISGETEAGTIESLLAYLLINLK